MKNPRYQSHAVDFAATMAKGALSACVDAIAAAGEEIWKSMRKWNGDPTSRDNHAVDCSCGDCT